MGKLSDSDPSMDQLKSQTAPEPEELLVEEDGDDGEVLEYVQQLINRMNSDSSQTPPTAPTKTAKPSSQPSSSHQSSQAKKTESNQVHSELAEGSNLATAALMARLANPSQSPEPEGQPESADPNPPAETPKRKPRVQQEPNEARTDLNRLREAANLNSHQALQTFGSKKIIRHAYVCLFLTVFFLVNACISRLISNPNNRLANVIVFGSVALSIIGSCVYCRMIKQTTRKIQGDDSDFETIE